jgi:hypothetical protein
MAARTRSDEALSGKTFFVNEQRRPLHQRSTTNDVALGWENLGGSSYRYPRLGTTDQPVEDWLNHIVPALMLFRAFVLGSACALQKFTLDVQSSSGFNRATQFGSLPLSGTDMKDSKLYSPINPSFGEKNLIQWLDGINYPYQT